MEVSIKAEPLFEVFGFPVTNSVLLGILGAIFLILWMLFVAMRAKKNIRESEEKSREILRKNYKNLAEKNENRAENSQNSDFANRDSSTSEFDKSNSFAQNDRNGEISREKSEIKQDFKFAKEENFEKKSRKNGFFTRLVFWAFEGLYKTVRETVPNKKIARQVAPFAISIFFIVAIQYYTGILPFAGEAFSLGHVPMFRSQAADLNFTFALAIITIVAVQVWAFRALGIKGNLKRYFVNPFRDPIGCFAGILELIGEFSRMIALAMRLFGNVFAGEVLLLVVSYLTGFVSPAILPFFYIFELFIGGIQAYVFFMLATVFVGIAVSHGHSAKNSDENLAENSISNHSDDAKQLSEVKV